MGTALIERANLSDSDIDAKNLLINDKAVQLPSGLVIFDFLN